MSHLLAMMLAAMELDDLNLLTTTMRLDRRGDLATLDHRRTDRDILAIGDHQHLIDLDCCAFFGCNLLDFEGLTLGNLILLATGFDYRVHLERLQLLPIQGDCHKRPRILAFTQEYVKPHNKPPKETGQATKARQKYKMLKIPKPQQANLNMDAVNNLLHEDMAAVNLLIEKRLHSDVALVNQLSSYIINSGGKRLRPLLVLLSARAFGYTGEQHFNLAAVVEFIHTATLLHDDVVDASDRRRGNETANSRWGNEAAVLVGDFLYSRAFQMMVESDSMHVMRILADATNVIAEGEVMQLLNCNDPDTTEQRYLDVIHCKTAKLFEAAAQLGAVLSHAPAKTGQNMARYGMHLGTAFQLVDDVLDYSASADKIGKNIGDDLAEGKPTLPLIRAMQQGTTRQSSLIRQAIKEGGREHIGAVTAAIESTDAIAYTARKAREAADKAIQCLHDVPPSIYADALKTLADFSVNRTF